MGETAAARLKRYVGTGKRMSIRSFAAAMKARSPRPKGSTRAMIHRYLSAGGPEPPAEFLRAAAKVLDLNPDYLLTGSGSPTGTEEAVQRAVNPATDRYVEQVGDLLRSEFEGHHALPSYDSLPAWARAAIWEVLGRFARSNYSATLEELLGDNEHPDPYGFAAEAAVGIAQSLSMPLQHFGTSVSPDAFADYVTLACQAIMRLIPSAAERAEMDALRERELDEKAARAPKLPPAGTPERKAEIEKRRKRYREVAELSRKHGKLDPGKNGPPA